MHPPNAATATPATPDYLRELIAQAGISQREAARRLGISERNFRHMLTGRLQCHYSTQYCLEALALLAHKPIANQ
jgi:transcriptional regulator with XRE-family HTH domain